MSVLGRGIRRDVGRHLVQYAGVAVTVLLGVALFAASYDAFANLQRSYARTYDRLGFADVVVTGGDSTSIAGAAADVAGVAAVTVRRQADVPLRVGTGHVMLGRVVELPDGGAPAVDRVDLLAGAAPPAGSVDAGLAERHMADHFGLGPHDTLEVRGSTGWHQVRLSGVVASAEYLWPARSRQDVLTSPDDFGVLFVATDVFDLLDPSDSVTQVLVRYAKGVDGDALDAAISELARRSAAGATVQFQADQPSNAALHEDVAGFGELSLLFPVLFLGAATMATFILLGRSVRAARSEIATLRANGMSTRQVAGHYLAQGVAVTTIAGVLGLTLGVAGGRFVTKLYTRAIDVPDTVTGFHLVTVVAGVVLSVATGALAAASPAIAAARVAPGIALRGMPSPTSGGRSFLEHVAPPLRRLPARWRMVLRGIGRDRWRSASTALGVILALTLVLASWGMVDTTQILLARQFQQVQRQDAQVYVDPSVNGVSAALEQVRGVARVEPVAQLEVVLASGDRRYATQLVGLENTTTMHGFGNTGPPTDGLVTGRSLARLLGVAAGDEVTVTSVATGSTATLRVDGFVDEPLGTLAYASLSRASSLAGPAARPSLLVQFAPDADRAQMRRVITSLPGVVAYVDARSLYDTARSLMSLFFVFVGVMLLFGGLMAFALIFNTTAVNAAERAAELAVFKANGASSGRLARLLSGENLLLTLLAILPGLAVGLATSSAFMGSFSSDLFDFGLHIRGTTLAWCTGFVLAVSLLAQWPAWRTIQRLDVARVVRERSR